MTGFYPVAGREELESAMRNRFYNNVSRPGSYGHRGVTSDMVRGRPRGVRGLGTVAETCDDAGVNLAMNIGHTTIGLIGTLIEGAGHSTVGEGGAKSGGSRDVATGGRTVRAVGDAGFAAWEASCLAARRGAATGATPSESMDSVLARARATWAADVEAGRGGDVLEAEDRAAAREDAREERAAAAAATTRNYILGGLAVLGVLGAGAYFFRK